MINWFKELDGYGWFLFIVLGIPGIVIVFHLLALMGLFAYKDFVGDELNLLALAGMVIFVGPFCMIIPLGFMGMFNDCGESAKGFVQGWGMFVLATIVLFVLPAFAAKGLAKLGLYDYIRTLIA